MAFVSAIVVSSDSYLFLLSLTASPFQLFFAFGGFRKCHYMSFCIPLLRLPLVFGIGEFHDISAGSSIINTPKLASRRWSSIDVPFLAPGIPSSRCVLILYLLLETDLMPPFSFSLEPRKDSVLSPTFWPLSLCVDIFGLAKLICISESVWWMSGIQIDRRSQNKFAYQQHNGNHYPTRCTCNPRPERVGCNLLRRT
jgi:hypothetical protein